MDRRSHVVSLIIVAVYSMCLYANTLNNGFVYDDEYTIVNNTFINKLENLSLLFDKKAYFSRSEEMSYRPIVTFAYFVDYAVYGLNPWGYHLTNLMLHTINGLLLYIFLSLLLAPSSLRFISPALLISILFVSHPVLTEAVNCISYREDLLAFLFYMATLSLYLILRTKPAADKRALTTAFLYFLSCLAYLLALLSKEMAVTLPLMALCYEWLYGEGETGLISRLFSRYIIGYAAITFFYLYLRFYLFDNPEEQILAWGLVERFLTMPWHIISYLKLSLFPVQLSADYAIQPVISIRSISFIWPFVSIVSILVVSFILRKEKGIFFGVLFFFTALLPVYNIIPINNPLAERYLYLPTAGLVIILGLFINNIGRWSKKLLFIFSLLILCIFAFAVVKRDSVWRDDYALWTDTLVKMPNSHRAHNNLGTIYADLGQLEDAVMEYKKALRLNPGYAEAHNNLGNAYGKLNRMEDAIPEFKIALRSSPDIAAAAYYNLGTVYDKLGRTEDAVSEYRKALNLKPYIAEIHQSLGIAYWHLSRMEDAVSEFRKALSLKPDYPEAHSNLGNLYDDAGRTEDAISEYRKALRFNPDHPDIQFNLGTAYKKKGLKDEARKAFENVLRYNPNDNEAREALNSLAGK